MSQNVVTPVLQCAICHVCWCCYVFCSIQEEKEAIAREKKMKADAKKKAEAERIARMVSGHTVYLGCNSSCFSS